jgi:hypothetical protein
MRTQHWFYRRSGAGDDQVRQLYAKPDDRWEVNEVSQRAAEIMEAFEGLTQWVAAQRDSPELPALPELPEIIARERR